MLGIAALLPSPAPMTTTHQQCDDVNYDKTLTPLTDIRL
jgi:hypothetical protein